MSTTTTTITEQFGTVNVTSSSPPTPDVTAFFSVKAHRIYDIIIGATLTLCFLVGLPGNILSLCYYLRRGDYASKVYRVICGIDICTIVSVIPVVVSLFDGRAPGLFGLRIFCVSWSVVFYYLVQASMFLVMVLSVSRTISIVNPFYQIRKRNMVVVFVVFTCYTISWDILTIGKTVFYDYDHITAYCYYDLEDGTFSSVEQTFYTLNIAIPPLVTAVSLIISVYKLVHAFAVAGTKRSRKTRQASLTLVLFTALFLTCNIPCFLNNALFAVSIFTSSVYPRPFYMSTFMFFYSWTLTDVVAVVVNAALNPVLYFIRVKGLRKWSRQFLMSWKGTNHSNEY